MAAAIGRDLQIVVRIKAAVAAGGTVKQGLKDQFYGDRSGTVTDPFGHIWTIATHKEDVSPDEMQRRMAKMPPDGQTA